MLFRSVGMWAGNNDNTPIDKKVAGLVVTPIWREFMDIALKNKKIEYFTPYVLDPNAPDYTRGNYCSPTLGSHSILYDLNMGDTIQAKLWQYQISNYNSSSSCPSLINLNSLSDNKYPSIPNIVLPTTTLQ